MYIPKSLYEDAKDNDDDAINLEQSEELPLKI